MGIVIGAGAVIVAALAVWAYHVVRLSISRAHLLRTLDRYDRQRRGL